MGKFCIISNSGFGFCGKDEGRTGMFCNWYIEKPVLICYNWRCKSETRIKNTPELVGMAAYVYMIPDLIFRINTKQNCRKITYLFTIVRFTDRV